MTGFLPTRPQSCPAPRSAAFSVSDAMRRHRVLPLKQCADTAAKLRNMRNLLDATEREYRMTLGELDRLNNEGRVWLVVDLIHKTSLASLDLAASMLQIGGTPAGETARKIADGTQTFSDVYTNVAGVADGSTSWTEAGRTIASRALTHTPVSSAKGTHIKGTADMALTGWGDLEKIVNENGTPGGDARTKEAAVNLAAGIVQRTAEAVETTTPGGSPVAKRAGALAQIAKAMASYNREIEGAFNRRLETSSSLMQSRAVFETDMKAAIQRYRLQVAELEAQMTQCRP